MFTENRTVQVHHDYRLDTDNTLALASTAQRLVCLDQVSQIPALQQIAQTEPSRWVLGGGSNMVLAPYIAGLVIKVQNRGIRLVSETATEVIVEAQAGENWHRFVSFCLEQGWLGLENLALIPGTVGAAPVQNIGAYGVELEQRVHSIQCWDLERAQWQHYTAQQCEFAYRDSLFKRAGAGRYLITAVQFILSKASGWQPVLRYPDLLQSPKLQHTINARAIFEAVIEVRQAKLPDPKQLANAGSFFKNPVISQANYERIRAQYPAVIAYPYEAQFNLAAGWLIERAGWKGKQLGPVGMHVRQALVLVNYGGATAREVAQLVERVQADVYDLFQVELEQEPITVT